MAACAGLLDQQFEAAYNVTTANYRETVLTAFQQIEDNLASLRLLSKEIRAARHAPCKSGAGETWRSPTTATDWESIHTST